jgi:phenylacetaldehyde dehydrogenase
MEATKMGTAVIDSHVTEFTRAPQQLLINGHWLDVASGESFVTPNPATSEPLATIASGGGRDIDRAVMAARAAFGHGPWRRMTPSERGRVVWKIGDLILEHAEELPDGQGPPGTLRHV